MLIKITSNELDVLAEKAKQSDRKRLNYNYHEKLDDKLQRMLNALHTGTYVQPHKHEDPDKREVFIILRGRIALIEFSDDGTPVNHIILDRNTGNYAVEIPPGTWHNLIALEDNSVVYEVKDGPYSASNDKNFAPWAPEEGDKNCRQYLENLVRMLKLK